MGRCVSLYDIGHPESGAPHGEYDQRTIAKRILKIVGLSIPETMTVEPLD